MGSLETVETTTYEKPISDGGLAAAIRSARRY
jgi:hypothetical protein